MGDFGYRLDLPDAVSAWLAASPDNLARGEARFRAWLVGEGIALRDGPAIARPRDGAPGAVLLDADRDPGPAWAALWAARSDLPPAPAETAAEQERGRLAALLAALDGGTATQAQAQRAIAWLLRRALAGDGDG